MDDVGVVTGTAYEFVAPCAAAVEPVIAVVALQFVVACSAEDLVVAGTRADNQHLDADDGEAAVCHCLEVRPGGIVEDEGLGPLSNVDDASVDAFAAIE